MSKLKRGFFGIGIFHAKNEENIGTLWRSASILGADFIFTIGKPYRHQSRIRLQGLRQGGHSRQYAEKDCYASKYT